MDTDLSSKRRKARSGKGFSPVMVGQNQMLGWLRSLNKVYEIEGWKTKSVREHLGLNKSCSKKAQSPESHANDGISIAAAHFTQYLPTKSGRKWIGAIRLTSAPFRVVTKPKLYRRQLHSVNYLAGGIRKRKGGTVTPWEFRSGDYVEASKMGKIYRGWIGGFTDIKVAKRLAVYDHNWHRIAQFTLSKVKLIRRSNNLCVA